MSEQNAIAKRKHAPSRRSYKKHKQPLEFSKKLTIADIIVYLVLTIILIGLLFFNPELDTFAGTIFAYITTAYVSLRLGYTAKAGVENYKKIAGNCKAIAELIPTDEQQEDDEPSDEEKSLG